MGDIYQQMWDADMEYAAVVSVKKGTIITADLEKSGYVVVDENLEDPNVKVVAEVLIPGEKRKPYDLAKALYNNYTLDQTKKETVTQAETVEVQAFLDEIYLSPPLKVARIFMSNAAQITPELQKAVSDDNAWWALIQRIWFEEFDLGNKNKDLSGFEHVFVGEQKDGAVSGYHFWHKYFLDEHFEINGQIKDLIKVLGAEKTQNSSPDVVTLKHTLNAFDYETEKFRPLTQAVGGFFVGPSPAGLVAMVMVRFFREVDAPLEAVINGNRYKLTMFKSENHRHLRTFFPETVEAN